MFQDSVLGTVRWSKCVIVVVFACYFYYEVFLNLRALFESILYETNPKNIVEHLLLNLNIFFYKATCCSAVMMNGTLYRQYSFIHVNNNSS